MKGIKVLAIAFLLLAFASAAVASGSGKMDSGKSWHLTLYHPTRVGTALLPPGDYKVQQVQDGERTWLAFKADRKEVARVGCKIEQLPTKADKTALLENTNSAGERVLVGIAFEGDRFKHDLGESVAQAR